MENGTEKEATGKRSIYLQVQARGEKAARCWERGWREVSKGKNNLEVEYRVLKI